MISEAKSIRDESDFSDLSCLQSGKGMVSLIMPSNENLFGGKVVSRKSLDSRLKELIKKKPQLPEVELLFTIPGHHTDFDNVLVFEGDTTIEGDLLIDEDQKWVEKNRIGFVVCFGNLRVNGDIINEAGDYWPLVAVEGTLSAKNLVKGGMPLIVWGDLLVDGYILPTYNDGPMRVGGDLSALGYVPRCKDVKEARGHAIGGSVSATVFDARREFKGRDVRRVVIEEALDNSWFDTEKVLEFGRERKSIWRDTPLEEPEVVIEPVPSEKIEGVNPLPLGRLSEAKSMLEPLQEKIRGKIKLDPERYSYPENFAEFVRAQLGYYPEGSVLILPAGTVIDGNLVLDWEEDWVQEKSICAIACEGDLTVKGDVVNQVLEGGVLLFVEGDLEAENVVKAGATLMVLGNLNAAGLVIGNYNDGVIRIGGNLRAEAFLLFDHDGCALGEISARQHSDEDTDWAETFVPEVFDEEDDYHPNVERVLARHKAGKSLFLE